MGRLCQTREETLAKHRITNARWYQKVKNDKTYRENNRRKCKEWLMAARENPRWNEAEKQRLQIWRDNEKRVRCVYVAFSNEHPTYAKIGATVNTRMRLHKYHQKDKSVKFEVVIPCTNHLDVEDHCIQILQQCFPRVYRCREWFVVGAQHQLFIDVVKNVICL